MSLHVAIGLLFLGGGKFSLNAQSDEAIAALVVSFFPVYPQHTKDGRYHLQAFRHLYVCGVVVGNIPWMGLPVWDHGVRRTGLMRFSLLVLLQVCVGRGIPLLAVLRR